MVCSFLSLEEGRKELSVLLKASALKLHPFAALAERNCRELIVLSVWQVKARRSKLEDEYLDCFRLCDTKVLKIRNKKPLGSCALEFVWTDPGHPCAALCFLRSETFS